MRTEPPVRVGWVELLSLWRGAHFEAQTEPSARFGWVESLSLWRGARLETEVSLRSADHKCPLEVSFRSVDQERRSSEVSTEVLPGSVGQKCC